MKKSIRTIMLVLCWIFMILIVGFIFASIIVNPVHLTDEEISSYSDIATKAWNDGLAKVELKDGVNLKPILSEKKINITFGNTNKESMTIDFSGGEKSVIINAPQVNFIACVIFYGIIFGSAIYFFIVGVLFTIFNKKKEKHE